MTKKISAVLILVLVSLNLYAGIVETNEHNLFKISPNKTEGVNFPGYIVIPEEGINPIINRIMVRFVHPGKMLSSVEAVEKYFLTHLQEEKGFLFSKRLSIPVLFIIVPEYVDDPVSFAPVSNVTGTFYPSSLDSRTVIAKGLYKDIELQYKTIIEKSIEFVNQKFNIQLEDKVIVSGESASGMVAIRFAFLQPELVHCVLAGVSGGLYPLPISKVDNTRLPYPFGTADYKTITGHEFNLDAWKQIHFFCCEGLQDDDRGFFSKHLYAWEKTPERIIKLNKKQRIEMSVKYYEIYTSFFEFVTYNNHGHSISMSDYISFIEANAGDDFNVIEPAEEATVYTSGKYIYNQQEI